VSVRPLNPAVISPATAAMFDLMADGNWHTNTAILTVGTTTILLSERDDAITAGRRVRRKTLAKGVTLTDDDLATSGANDIARNRLMIAVRSGRVERDSDQHRMLPAAVAQWIELRTAAPAPTHIAPTAAEVPARTRAARPAPARTAAEPIAVTEPADTTGPGRKTLIFGGLTEEQGFAAAPVTARDRVHFRTDKELPLRSFRADLPAGVTVTLDEGEGLYRVEGACGTGAGLADFVKAWCEVHGYKTIGLRPEANVKRRSPRDLDYRFLDDLCKHYGPVSLRRLQRNMSTVKMHISESDDVSQQVYEWILEAVTRYDETKGVPFGAYLVQSISKWVHDLNRNAYGRTAADAENKQQKAINALITLNGGRKPTEKELADHMGVNVETLRRNAQTVATLNGLRNASSIEAASFGDDAEIPLPDAHLADDDLADDTDSSLISAALTAACAPDPDARGRASQANVLGLVSLYMTTWGGKTKTDLAADLNTSMRNMNVYADRAADGMRARLAGVLG